MALRAGQDVRPGTAFRLGVKRRDGRESGGNQHSTGDIQNHHRAVGVEQEGEAVSGVTGDDGRLWAELRKLTGQRALAGHEEAHFLEY